MKRILLTGNHSYIGTSFIENMNKIGSRYIFESVSVRNNEWKDIDFSVYDTVIHLAAIVHSKEKSENIFFDVNRDLTRTIAEKSKKSGVKHFIFLSTMSVFGKQTGVIDSSTVPNPKTAYGKSKLQAEVLLRSLASNDFVVSIIRPPMVYGKNCSGNYKKFSKFIKKVPVFLNVPNRRSMIHIDNLTQFLMLVLDNKISGTFHPQNAELVSVSEMAQEILYNRKKKLVMIPCNRFIYDKLLTRNIFLSKIFTDLIYKEDLVGSPNTKYNGIDFDYCKHNFKESIFLSEIV